MRIPENEQLVENSVLIPIKPNSSYKVTSKITCTRCGWKCGYFGAIVLDSMDRETLRRVKWFVPDEKTRQYTILFTTPPNGMSVVLAYRINTESFLKSQFEIEFQPLSEIEVQELDQILYEEYDFGPNDYQIPKLDDLTPEEEVQMERKMVWLFASPRSGTTWLGDQLLHHQKNVIWHEPYIGWLLGAFRPWQLTDERYFFSFTHKENWLPMVRKLILSRTFSMAQTLDRNVIIKEPNGSGGTDLLLECFPNSKLIFLMRDGRDVIDSYLDARQVEGWTQQDPLTAMEPVLTSEERRKAIYEHATEWKKFVETIWYGYEKHKKDLSILIKYEDLRRDTFNELRKIYDFIDVKISDEELLTIINAYKFENIPDDKKGTGKFYRVASPGLWSTKFNEEELNYIEKLIGSTLRRFGYM